MKHLAFLFASIIFLFSIFPAAMGAPQKMVKKDDLILNIVRMKYTDKYSEIEYEIINITERDIWVCVSNDRYKYPNYESRVSKEEKKVIINLKTFIVPRDILLEEPIFSRYQRLPSKSSKTFKITLEFPIYDHSPLNTNKGNRLKMAQIEWIDITLGYYKILLAQDDKCCLKTSDENELLLNRFWAEFNPEKSISIQINK